jgi:Mce-associated membrane protein
VARTTAEEQATEGAETEPAEEETPVERTTAADEPPARSASPGGTAEDETAVQDETAVEDATVEDEAAVEERAEPEEDPGEDAVESSPDRPRRRLPRISDPVSVAATVLVVLAGACAAYFGWSWYRAAHDDALAYSRARDAVLRAAEQGAQNMNTLDYRKVDQGLTSWEDSSTGDLHQELVQGRAQFTSQVQLAKTVTTAKILDGAVTELNDRTGKAGVIVAVQITVTPPAGAPTTKQSRMRAQLTRTPSGWKLSALGQAPVGTTAGGG